MKMKIAIALTLVLIITPSVWCDYSISFSTIDGGGGRSEGGQYKLTGTIGQPGIWMAEIMSCSAGSGRGGLCALSISKNLLSLRSTGSKPEVICRLTLMPMGTWTLKIWMFLFIIGSAYAPMTGL